MEKQKQAMQLQITKLVIVKRFLCKKVFRDDFSETKIKLFKGKE